MSLNSGIKKSILKELAKSRIGVTNLELSEKLGYTKQQVNDSLRESLGNGYVLKGESLGVEGILYTITAQGLAYVGVKIKTPVLDVKKSPLTQTVKTTVKTVQPAPIVEESPLKQKSNTTEGDIRVFNQHDFDMRVNPNHRHAIEDFERHLPPLASEQVKTIQPTLSLLDQITQIMVEAEAKAQALFLSQTPREISNLKIKVDLLHTLAKAPLFNPSAVALLVQIAEDVERV